MEKAPGETVGGEVWQKRCAKCGVIKSIDMFREKRNRCKECENIAAEIYRIQNIEKRRESQKRYSSQNREIINAQARKRHKQNPQKEREKRRKKREKYEYKEKQKERSKKWRLQNTGRVKGERLCVVDRYVRDLLKNQYGLKSSECTPELIEAKRKEVLMKREMKEIRKRLKEIDNVTD